MCGESLHTPFDHCLDLKNPLPEYVRDIVAPSPLSFLTNSTTLRSEQKAESSENLLPHEAENKEKEICFIS